MNESKDNELKVESKIKRVSKETKSNRGAKKIYIKGKKCGVPIRYRY